MTFLEDFKFFVAASGISIRHACFVNERGKQIGECEII